MFKKFFLAVSVAALTSPAIAAEDWWMAESDHFRVYSAGDEEDAREMAFELERVDQAMRMFRGMPLEGEEIPESSKPNVYQFGSTDDIGALIGSSSVAGFFIPRAGNSVAFVPLEERNRRRRGSLGARREQSFTLDPASVIRHEYAHYFMFQHAPAAYPFWYVEGFAELFGAMELNGDSFNLGEAPHYRQQSIQHLGFNIREILDPDIEDANLFDVERQYAYGWMVTNYLSFEPSRQGQLIEYLNLLNQGVPNLDAAEQAFGDLNQLQRDLESYRRGRVRGISVSFPESSRPEITVRKLTEAENESMRLHVDSTSGVTEDQAKDLIPKARDLVARFPEEPAVLSAAMEAEYDAENLSEAEQLAERLIAVEEDSIRARLYLARIAMKRAQEDESQLDEARQWFVQANQIDSNRPEALRGFYLTYALKGEEPPESALIALETAYRLAPFDNTTRRILAHLLLTENRDEEAISILGPVVFTPHGGKRARELRDLVEKLENGERQPLIEELRPQIDEDDDEISDT